MSERTLSCILLAAGMSTRMGEQNKLLLSYAGKTVIRHTAELLVDYGFTEIVVVVGHEANAVVAELQGLPVTCVFNADYQTGQMTSVHTGLKTLTQNVDGMVICLGDLVLLTRDDIRALHQAFNDADKSILVPMYQGERGNPIILDASHREAIVAGEKNLGCRKLIQKNPDEVGVYEAQNNHVLFDIDTPDKWKEFKQLRANSSDTCADESRRELIA